MSDPAKAPVLLMQESLERLVHQTMTLAETTSGMQQQLTQLVQDRQRQRKASGTPPALWSWRGFGSGVVVGAVLLGAAWGLGRRPPPGAAVLLRTVDPVLVQHYPWLPHGTQAALNAAYLQAGAPSPGQRQGR